MRAGNIGTEEEIIEVPVTAPVEQPAEAPAWPPYPDPVPNTPTVPEPVEPVKVPG